MKILKKLTALILALSLTAAAAAASAGGDVPPAPPEGGFGGTPPQGGPPEGGFPGEPPEGGFGGGPGGMPGGPVSAAEIEYTAVLTEDSDAAITGETLTSAGADENALLVTGGTTTVSGATISRVSADSTGGDSASFYGVGAAVLATGGTVQISGSEISTDSKGGAGVFAYGDGVVHVSDTTITTRQDASGGIHVAGGGTLYATDLTIETNGGSSAAIRSDRGGGTMIVSGGSYTANGSGSPAVYVTADIAISRAALTATGSEALCLEGRNSVVLTDCTLSGSMKDLEINNGNTWTVILYQSMSGDSEVGKGSFTMTGGTLISENGGVFYTTNTESEFTLQNVEIIASEGSEYLLRCTGNENGRGWGTVGSNGAVCTFTAIDQALSGTVIWDTVSELTFSLTEGSSLTGAVVVDDSEAGEGGSGSCSVTVDESSAWIVTGDSTVTALTLKGSLTDADGRKVTVAGTDGTVYVEGDSEWTVTVSSFAG